MGIEWVMGVMARNAHPTAHSQRSHDKIDVDEACAQHNRTKSLTTLPIQDIHEKTHQCWLISLDIQ